LEASLNDIEGCVWKFGDDVSTEIIFPSKCLQMNPKEALKHAFEAIKPGLSEIVQAGDVVVAGRNFGWGSCRESASLVLRELGFSACVADSFARLFFRNCVALGFPVLLHDGISKSFREGDRIRLSISNGMVKNLTTGMTATTRVPDAVLNVLKAGGLRPLIIARARQLRRPTSFL
jgi:3-isopropylmalate/(R)-2-methylmalate dehydratase small subunit